MSGRILPLCFGTIFRAEWYSLKDQAEPNLSVEFQGRDAMGPLLLAILVAPLPLMLTMAARGLLTPLRVARIEPLRTGHLPRLPRAARSR